jgi:hypothetical protein
MTIYYSITPNEVTKSFFKQLRFSPAFRIRIFLYAGLIGLIYLLPKLLRQAIHVSDIIVTLPLMLGLVLLLPIATRFLTKPQQRTLTIDAQGIQTSIGKQSGSIPWTKIADIVQDGEFLFIIGQTGNSFLIPSRAFTTQGQRQAFLDAIASYRAAALAG